jgi:ubiquinone/menaquinone biosynthesis C-methylase UbiE
MLRDTLAALALASVVIFGAASCGSSSTAEPIAGSGTGSAAPNASQDSIAREQAQFDAMRQPDNVVAALGLKPGMKVADIGAGSGLLTVHLARAVAPNGKVVATDVENVVFDMMKQRLAAANLANLVEMRLVKKDVPNLEAGAYDAILLSEVDNYFDDPVDWLKQAMKALKPGGKIVITNRIHRSAVSLANAKSAGLKLESNTTPEPSHFIAVFGAP